MTLEVVELGASLSTCTLLNQTLENRAYANYFSIIHITALFKKLTGQNLNKKVYYLIFIDIRVSQITYRDGNIFSVDKKI